MISMKRKRKNRPENGIRTTTSPLVVQNPTNWPVRRESSKCESRTSSPCLRKGERGVVRGNPLALRRRAIPGSLKRLSPVGWILAKSIVSAHFCFSSFLARVSNAFISDDGTEKANRMPDRRPSAKVARRRRPKHDVRSPQVRKKFRSYARSAELESNPVIAFEITTHRALFV
jgi:hypothetical protein